MASFKSTNMSQVHLFRDHTYTHPADKSLVELKAGEKFHLVEKVSENWWSVIRTEQDRQLLYVPACYVEEIPYGKPLDVAGGLPGRKEPPPKPPLKPKNYTGKRELLLEANKSFPAITPEANIELFNILMSQSNGKSKSQEAENEAGYKSSDDSELEREGHVDGNMEFRRRWSDGKDVFDENSGSMMRHGHKGSMQSLDLEFLDDCEVVDVSSDDKSPADASEQLYVNAGLLRSQQSGLPPWPPDGAVPLKTFEGGYESYYDNGSGRTYYYNRVTQERSWILPRKVSQSAKEDSKNGLSAVPSIWREETNANGETVFVNQISGDKWVRMFDSQHKEYFFNDKRQESLWDLPECDSIDGQKFSDNSDQDIYQFSDKVGVLYKAKLSDNGKKIKKSWSQSYVVLCGSMLYFHKEQKATNSKVNMSKPEGFLDLRLTSVQMGNNCRSSRKNLIQLTTPSGTEYLLHHEEIDVIEEWYEALSKNISLLAKLMSTLKTEKAGSSQSLNSELDKSPSTSVLDPASPGIQMKSKEKHKQPKKEMATVQQETVQSSSEKTRLKEKLRFWLNRRPTRDSLRAKGIYKEGIFGSHLLTICEKENTTIPKFVQDCIDAVEARGLTMDGIYRLSGNMAEIQKLRFAVNQNDDYNLMDPDLDIHVVTGALKLFFRELMEPLFPFRLFKKFLETYKITDPTAKSKAFRELVLLIPTANHDTLKELFRHLVLVIHHSHENRMQAQNIAIVFGPTLMWPEESDMSDLAVSLVQRGQIIEHILQDYTFIFS